MIFKKSGLNLFLGLAVYHICTGESNYKVERNPLQIGGNVEFGQIMQGKETEYDVELKGDVVTRLGVYISQHYVIDQKMDVRVGVGGLFWYSFPPLTGLGFSHVTRFGPGINEASVVYHFGSHEKRDKYLQVGFFPIKYNEDAANLGEYLFRSQAYPSTVWTGGWSIVNSAAYMGQGIRLHWEQWQGKLKHDLTFLMERDFAPMNDISPTYMVSLEAGAFSFSTGISLHHFLPMKPSRLDPKDNLNTYLQFEYFPATTGLYDSTLEGSQLVIEEVQTPGLAGSREGLYDMLSETYSNSGTPLNDKSNPITAKIFRDVVSPQNEKYAYQGLPDQTFFTNNNITAITTAMASEKVFVDAFSGTAFDSTGISDINQKIWINNINGQLLPPESVPVGDPNFSQTNFNRYEQQNRYQETEEFLYKRKETQFTHQGIKLMGRVSLDVKKIFGWDEMFKPYDLKLFAEAALLGFKNYPHYYEDRTKRIPFMFGINLPTFGLLDMLSLQMERFNSYFPNNSRMLQFQVLPIPYVEDVKNFSPSNRDNWSWSILGRKNIGPFNIYFQAAQDHFRTLTFQGRPSYDPVVRHPGDWYYMVKLEFGI